MGRNTVPLATLLGARLESSILIHQRNHVSATTTFRCFGVYRKSPGSLTGYRSAICDVARCGPAGPSSAGREEGGGPIYSTGSRFLRTGPQPRAASPPDYNLHAFLPQIRRPSQRPAAALLSPQQGSRSPHNPNRKPNPKTKIQATAPVLCRGPFADMEPTNPRHKGDAVATRLPS